MNQLKCETFFFIRHGRTEWNVVDRIMPLQIDEPLDQMGVQQVTEAAEKLSKFKFSAIVSSPLLRTRQTAEAIALKSGIPFITHNGFIEADPGSWGGKLFSEICIEQGLDPYGTISPKHAPNSEPISSVHQRVLAATIECSEKYGDNFLIVAHGGTFEALNCSLNGNATKLPKNAIPFKFSFAKQAWSIENL
jgi:broad specificity phosphatase PhoE